MKKGTSRKRGVPETDTSGDADPSSRRTGDEFLVVGIGASAGGIKALKEFFARVPSESDMAYVVILHLSPEHESHLAEVLEGVTDYAIIIQDMDAHRSLESGRGAHVRLHRGGGHRPVHRNHLHARRPGPVSLPEEGAVD